MKETKNKQATAKTHVAARCAALLQAKNRHNRYARVADNTLNEEGRE